MFEQQISKLYYVIRAHWYCSINKRQQFFSKTVKHQNLISCYIIRRYTVPLFLFLTYSGIGLSIYTYRGSWKRVAWYLVCSSFTLENMLFSCPPFDPGVAWCSTDVLAGADGGRVGPSRANTIAQSWVSGGCQYWQRKDHLPGRVANVTCQPRHSSTGRNFVMAITKLFDVLQTFLTLYKSKTSVHQMKSQRCNVPK